MFRPLLIFRLYFASLVSFSVKNMLHEFFWRSPDWRFTAGSKFAVFRPGCDDHHHVHNRPPPPTFYLISQHNITQNNTTCASITLYTVYPYPMISVRSMLNYLMHAMYAIDTSRMCMWRVSVPCDCTGIHATVVQGVCTNALLYIVMLSSITCFMKTRGKMS